MKKKGLSKRQKKQIMVGGIAVAAVLGVGGLLYYLSTSAKGETLEFGKTYCFDYTPGVINASEFLVSSDFPYNTASELKTAIGPNCTQVMKWLPESQMWQPYPPAAGNFTIAPGDGIRIVYDNSFCWTV